MIQIISGEIVPTIAAFFVGVLWFTPALFKVNKIVAKLRVTSIDELLYFCYIKRSELYEVIKMSEKINNEIELQKNNEQD